MTTASSRAVARVVCATTAQSPDATLWTQINWASAGAEVQRLQQRIFRAAKQGQWRKVRDLQKLLLRNHSNLALSVRCAVCRGILLNGESFDEHHKVTVKRGGNDSLANLELRHEACHYNSHHWNDSIAMHHEPDEGMTFKSGSWGGGVP